MAHRRKGRAGYCWMERQNSSTSHHAVSQLARLYMVLMGTRGIVIMTIHHIGVVMMQRMFMSGHLSSHLRRTRICMGEAAGDRNQSDQCGGDKPEHESEGRRSSHRKVKRQSV